ncbi:MAG: GH92 family glycosyl hydrolase [bacterium]|nr:GH92 family glycosyl hydrolase [Candidatus Colisoma equi]
MKRIGLAVVGTLCAGAAFGDFAEYVDPFTGTAGTGHTHPAACVPFGMVQAGPDTGCNDWAYCPGYQFRDTSVLGYSLTHLSGTGCPDYGDVQILPFTGAFGPMPMRRAIDKASEKAYPGYYRVVQPEDGLTVEVTAAKRAALYRLRGGHGGEIKVLLNLTFGLGDHVYEKDPKKVNVRTGDAKGEIAGTRALSGEYYRTGWIMRRRIAYAIEFSRDWKSIERVPGTLGTPDEAPRYVVTFEVPEGGELLVKAGLSMTGADGAKRNLAADMSGWDFEAVRAAAREKWNALLARSTCEGSDDQKRNWYTALYHLYGQPNDYADVDGRFSAADGSVRQSSDGTYFTTLSLWDTFRAAQPWYTIAAPEVVEPIVRSMLSHYATFGRLPVMSYGGKNVDCMVGNHSLPIIADAYAKGFRDFDQALAFEAVTNTLTVAHPGKPKEDWNLWDKYGYFPCDIIRGESVSRALECSYGDWCAAQYLTAIGRAKEAAFFARRAQNWKNVFDTSIGFGRGKTAAGKWREPFDPYAFGHGAENDNDFTEGNAFQYSWHVMQDVPGLVAAMGGRDKFVERLDSLFTTKQQGPDTKGGTILLDISGMIGQYVHGNEPSHHVIYFYPQVGYPEKAAEKIREVFDTQYHVGPEGLCGNDDCGQMSAWYVFSAMGFYPFNPCGGEYVIGAPQVPAAQVKVRGEGEERTFRVLAKGLSKENKYVKSVMLNGKPITDWKIRHADIVKGGELVFEMGTR